MVCRVTGLVAPFESFLKAPRPRTAQFSLGFSWALMRISSTPGTYAFNRRIKSLPLGSGSEFLAAQELEAVISEGILSL